MITQEDIEREIQLEEDAVGLGMKRYRETLKERGESEMPPGMKLTKILVDKFLVAYQDWCKGVIGGQARKQATLVHFCEQFEPEMLAYVTAKMCVNAIVQGTNISTLSMKISQFLLNEVNAHRFSEQDKEHYKKTIKHLKKCTSERHQIGRAHV